MIRRIVIALCLMIALGASAAHADRKTVDVTTANIRSGPGTSHEILWKVERYHPIEVIKSSGGWYQFRDYEGDRGWIYKDLIKDMDSVIVIKDRCNIRSGPGTDNEVVFTVERGVPFKVLERKGNWIHIQHADGDKGWIHKMLVW
jgi:SH3-like domain-containing protein